MRNNRKNYKVLSEQEQKEYFDDITNDFYNICIANKDKLIKVVQDFHYIRKNTLGLNTTIGNGLASYVLDFFISKAISGNYVDLKGYDIAVEDYGKTIRVSSKAMKNMFAKQGTNQIIDSNKLASSENYDDNAHMGTIDSDVYIMVQTNNQIIVAIGPKKISELMAKSTGSNTLFTVPNDSYIKYIISREDNIVIDENYVPEDVNIINAISAWNKMLNEYGTKENNDTKESV